MATILADAKRQRLVEHNFASRDYIAPIQGHKKEVKILNDKEAKILVVYLDKLDNPRWKIALLIALFMGIRRGELAGLEWKHIDFDKNMIHIVQSSIYVNPELGIITKDPKSKTSKRTIRMPNVMANILKEYKVWYDNKKKRHGSAWKNKDRVICKPNGEIITPSTIRLWLTKLLEENNIRRVSSHSLRHTNITIQLRNKIPPKAVARFVGHSDPSVTLDVYSHFLEEDEDDFVDLFDNLFKKKN